MQDGIRFDSQKEANRYWEIKMMERAGKVKNVQLQPRFVLQENFEHNGKKHREISYVADFMYEDEQGKTIVEDVKSAMTKKLPVYRMKKKMLLYKYPNIFFIET